MWYLFAALIGLAGAGLAAIGQAQVNEQKIKESERKARQLRDTQAIYDAEQAVIKTQQAEVDKDILAAGQIYNINKKTFAIQGQEIALQGAAAKGSTVARAGAGNLAGASILRQITSVQKGTQRQMSILAGEKEKLDIGYSDTLREFDIKKQELGVTLLTSEMKEKFALEDATALQDEADWLKKYGWMSVLGITLQGAAGAIPALAKI